MRLYNTLPRKLEEFKPISANKILFYHCGPTVYWIQHIGNLRAMVLGDLIRRSFTYLGYQVKFVRNYTDVGHLTSDADEGEDKMDKGAKRENLTPKQIADKYIAIFENDTDNLNIIPPDHKPRASQYIIGIIEMVKTLLAKNFAYVTQFAVYYNVSKFKNYNQLNKQKIDLNIKGLGKGKTDDPDKKHFSDFALWIFKKGAHENALQTWDSPWGVGFPGWHIECSVMAKQLLGNTIDIHMGGVEHISIHHTNEIAQSESANGVKFVNYWLHNEHLNVDAAKMAKSEGTGFTLQQIINRGFDPMDLRYFFLTAHYRSKQNFTWEALKAAQEAYNKLKDYTLSLKSQILQKIRTSLSSEKLDQLDEFRQRFSHFISDDFQIPQALAVTWELIKSNIPSSDKLDLLLQFDQVFGLRLNQVMTDKIPDQITKLVKEREEVRKKGDFTKSDKLRMQIESLGYIVEDKPQGYNIKKRSN